MNLKAEIVTYKRKVWFQTRKVWVAMCLTKLPVEIDTIYAESETEAFNQMKDKIDHMLKCLEHDSRYAVRTIEYETFDYGTRWSGRWTGPALRD